MYITHIDTACVLIEINGFRILTDPTLDHAGGTYYHGFGAVSKKTSEPVLPAGGLENIDLVLLSHHQHKDNLDNTGRAFTAKASLVLSTKNAARRIKNVTGLDEWESYPISTDKIPGLKITATPARHRPGWIPEVVSGKVIGFIIEHDQQKNGVIYLSGDTVYYKGIDEVASRYRIDTGIFNVGGVQFRYLTGHGKYTMDAKGLIKAVSKLQPRVVIPVHETGWTHFKEKQQTLRNILCKDPLTKDRTIFLESGKRTEI